LTTPIVAALVAIACIDKLYGKTDGKVINGWFNTMLSFGKYTVEVSDACVGVIKVYLLSITIFVAVVYPVYGIDITVGTPIGYKYILTLFVAETELTLQKVEIFNCCPAENAEDIVKDPTPVAKVGSPTIVSGPG
jgi:hypothetical protein